MDVSEFKSLKPGANRSDLKWESEALIILYLRECGFIKGWIDPREVSKYYNLGSKGSIIFRHRLENRERRKMINVYMTRKIKKGYDFRFEYLVEIVTERV